MKQIVKFFIVIMSSFIGCLVLTSYSFGGNNSSSDSYDIAGIFEKVEVPDGSKVLISLDGLKETDALFVPSKLETGKYTVEVTKEEQDFYHICDTDLYIETRYCYKYATREEVVLNITSNYGYTKGEIIFF
ncbi:MAG: hypothetical protein J6N54_12340 [Bacteroidales bacterium]|nr:hypothetical protein [Bacteroidales bacterium]